jgi:hypothetical protein
MKVKVEVMFVQIFEIFRSTAMREEMQTTDYEIGFALPGFL